MSVRDNPPTFDIPLLMLEPTIEAVQILTSIRQRHHEQLTYDFESLVLLRGTLLDLLRNPELNESWVESGSYPPARDLVLDLAYEVQGLMDEGRFDPELELSTKLLSLAMQDTPVIPAIVEQTARMMTSNPHPKYRAAIVALWLALAGCTGHAVASDGEITPQDIPIVMEFIIPPLIVYITEKADQDDRLRGADQEREGY